MKKLYYFCLVCLISMLPTILKAQTTTINGLTVVMNYPDLSFRNSLDSISMMMNQTGFSSWGVNGSVKDFYYTQTNGKVLITSQVIQVTLPQNASYYHNGPGGDNMVQHIVTEINKQFPNGFTNLTAKPEEGGLWFFNLITRYPGGGFAFGFENAFIKNNGVPLEIKRGNISFLGTTDQPSINTICHEMGHSVMSWTDYYITNRSNLGGFCVMASAGSKTPMPINPALRYRKGWANATEINPALTATYTVPANSYNQVFKYTNPNNPREYLIISAHMYAGYYQAAVAPDQGLGIYYVDEDAGLYTYDGSSGPLVHLIQADGLDEMHDEKSPDKRGDANDLFDNATPTFSSSTHPFRWKNGNETGLTLTNISAPGATMTFRVQARVNTISSQTSFSNGGTISPSGSIALATGQSKTFTIVPEIGYEVNNVLVDGVSKGAVTSYVINTAGNHTISATFKQRLTGDALPTPWQKTEIGATRSAGAAGYRNGMFGLESGSYDIYGTNDGLNFIYQTLTGDGEIIAHIKDMNKPHDWSKAGIMIRETLTSNSKQFMIVKTPYNSIAAQLRPETGGESMNNPQNKDQLHVYNLNNWLKIKREGNNFSSYCSRDGVDWILMGTYTISMNQTAYVGLCAGAASNALNTKVTFDNAMVIKSNTFTNLALNKPTVASSVENAGTPATGATDGNGTSRWASAFSDSQWIYVDLGQSYAVNQVKITWEGAYGKDYKIQVSDNLSTWNDLKTVTGNTSLVNDWTTLTGSGRYVRMIGTARGTAYGYSIFELEVYGTAAPTNKYPVAILTTPSNNSSYTYGTTIVLNATVSDEDGTISKVEYYNNGSSLIASFTSAPYMTGWSNVAPGTYTLTVKATDNMGAVTTSAPVTIVVNPAGTPNLALNKPTFSSSVENAGTPANAATDGNTTSRWSSAFSDSQWIYVDLGQTYSVNRVKITWEGAYGKDYKVQVSNNLSTWNDLKTVSGNTALVNDWTALTGSGRYVRILGTLRGTPYGYSIFELEVYGNSSAREELTMNTNDMEVNKLMVSPNPAVNDLHISIASAEASYGAVMIIDITGKIVHSSILEGNDGNIDVSDLETGLYLIHYLLNGKRSMEKLTIIR